MDTKALRQKILDLAIRGKLVPQDPADEPADVLLERIRAEKQQMVKDGKLKAKDIKNDTVIYVGEDNLHYEKFSDGTEKCIEDEIPFKIPDGWAWARVFNVSTDLPYGTAKKSYPAGKMAVLRMGNLQNGEIDYRDLVYSSDEEDIAKYSLCPGDLLFNRTNSAELVGKTAIYRGSVPAIYAGYLIRIHPLVNPEYLNAVMNSQYAKQYCYYVKADSVSQSNINANKLGAFLIPIPPANEQKSISKEVSVFLPIISALQEHETKVKELCAEAKSRILDLAIRGKLVPQDPADEPASVLLERIRADKEEQIKAGKIMRDKKGSFIFRGEDNSYYLKRDDSCESLNAWDFGDLPNSWCICLLGEVCDYGNCINVDSESIADGDWVLDLEDIEKDTGKVITRVTKRERDAASTKHKFNKGQVLYSKLRPYLNKVVLADGDGYCTSEIIPLEFAAEVHPAYARYYLMSPTFLAYANRCSYGVKMPRLSTEDGRTAAFIIPPYREQVRIAERITSIFEKIDLIQNEI